MANKKIPDGNGNGNEDGNAVTPGKNLNEVDIAHLLYLGGLLCEAIDTLRNDLLKKECYEITQKIYKIDSWHRVLTLRKRFEEVALMDKSGSKFLDQ